MSDKLIYLAGPYSYDPEAAFTLHMAYTAAIMENFNHLVFSPIVHNHPLAKTHTLPTDYTFWQFYNKGMILKSDEVWVMNVPEWEKSMGTQYEISVADEHGKALKHVWLGKELHVFNFVRYL